MTIAELGDLDLINSPHVRLEALGTDSGTDWGNPQPIETSVESFLQYGSLVTFRGLENRVLMLAVRAVSTDIDALADAEALLAAQLFKPNRFLLQAKGAQVPTVYRVLTSSFDRVPDDLLEVMAGHRIYMLRLVCEPLVYSAKETVVPALGAPPASVVEATVDDCTSTSNWYGSYNGYDAPPAQGTFDGRSMVYATSPSTNQRVNMIERRVGGIDTSVTKYLVIDWAWTGGTPVDVGLSVYSSSGASMIKVSESISPVLGDMRTVVKVADSVTSLPDLWFSFTTDPVSPPTGNGLESFLGTFDVRRLFVDKIVRTNSPVAYSGKQQLRTFDVAGSMPTSGSIVVEHETSALGDGTMVFTYPADGAAANGYTPQCMQYKIGGAAPTSDSAAVSGGFVNVRTAQFFSCPTLSLPDGTYQVWARMRSAESSAAINWSVTPQLPVGNAIGATEERRKTVIMGGSVYKTVCLGAIQLPLIDTGLIGSTLIGVNTVNPVDVFLDELWLFNMSIGQLTGVNLGNGTPTAGGPSRRLFIDSPSLGNEGLGALMRGHSADRSDSFSAFPVSFSEGVHSFPAGPVKVFTVTPNANGAQASFRYAEAAMHTAAG